MWNRPISGFSAENAAGNGSEWGTDRHPTRRLAWLFLALLLPVAVIAGRLFYLQNVIADEFLDPPETLTESYEWIPARDGRILSAEGVVLAEDVVRYEVHAHYRWLEQPADPGWLRRRAFARIGKSDRRNRELVLAARRDVEHEHAAVWERLSRLTGIDVAELSRRRQRIQQRIEHRIEIVQLRRDERADAESETTDAEEDEVADDIAERVWRQVVTMLTTPPHRERKEPVVLPEQSDYHRVLDDIPEAAAREMESHPELYPGLQVRKATRRRYPEQTTAAHLVGYRIPSNESPQIQSAEIDGKTVSLPPRTTTVGRTGIESSYNESLRGRPGLRRITRNNRGEILRTEIVRPPRAGHDVVLTLDNALQRRLERLLDEAVAKQQADIKPGESPPPRGGCLVAVDIHTGAVLAAASAPRFDLNVLTESRNDEWRTLTADPRRPLFPRESRMTLPPGSVFKTVSAVAVLESGKIDPDARLPCRGYLDKPDRHRCYIFRHFGVGHGDTNLSDAIARSCNVYFYTAARQLGPNPLVEWGERFGFGQPTGIDISGERRGLLPSPSTRNNVLLASHRKSPPWYPGDTLGLAIGQSRLTATPLQIARMMAAVANDGYLVTPHLLRRIDAARKTGDESPPPRLFPRTRIPGLSEGTLQRVREGLRNVVENPRGTGYKHVRLDGIRIAGKTGTAEVGGGLPDHAWFAGYAPAHNPRVAFVVVLEHAGSGGSIAGPLAKQLVQSLLDVGLIRAVATK